MLPKPPAFLRTAAVGALTFAVSAAALAGCANPSVNQSGSSSAPAAIPAVAKDETLASLVPARLRDAGAVRVATNAPFAPYQMFASPGSEELIGLEIDLGHAIGETLGVPFEFSQQPYDGLIPGLQAGKYDILMATLFDTAEREQQLDFVNYARSGSGILVKKTNTDIKTLDDLCGKAVGVQNGSLQADLVATQGEKCTAAGKAPVEVKALPAFSDEQLALNSGSITSIVGDLPALAYAATQDATVKVLDDPAAPGGYESSLIGVGIPKSEKQLSEAVAKAIQKLMDDGTYKAILDKYGVAQTAIEKPLTNQHGG
ncbi:ABC transporter substrate-binding protein [Neomicrococcus lactis]